MADTKARIRAIRHATFETADVSRMAAYYEEIMGLAAVERAKDVAYLACVGQAPSVVLKAGSGPRCLSIALDSADLDGVAAVARAAGVAVSERSDPHPGIARSVVLATPHDAEVEVLLPSPAQAALGTEKAIAPKKLGHVAFNVGDVQTAVKFYTDVLGFRVSDWMGDFFAFLRCGPDHHTVNVLPGKREKMHHIAFEAADWSAIRRACDHLGPRGYPLIWGPGRHGVGHNIFIYHKNPDGQIVELYTELDQMSDEAAGFFDPRPWHEDKPQRPKVWTPGVGASNQWGIPTPDAFRE